MNEQKQSYPVVIIGAGPVGLAAAAHLVRKGETPLLFEAGATVGASMLQWGHVRLFSPWRYVVDQQAQALLADQDSAPGRAPAPGEDTLVAENGFCFETC
jgi:2-polyprenyl-6-methoxyphenol hydroxylase-like FAD-dependent oxidoreductase